MAITIDWATKIISVPKADTTLVSASPDIRELNLQAFKDTLANLTDEEEAMPFVKPYQYVGPITVGGVALAAVLEIINGYTVTFENGAYAINLVGLNSNVGDVVNVNNVSIRSANSAGLTFSKQAEDTAFEDARVWIDTVNGQPGTTYPIGSVSSPVDNLADAQSIISTRSLPKRIHLSGTVVTSGSDDISSYDIFGASSKLSTLDVTTGTITTNLVVERLSMTGDLNGNVTGTNSVSFGSIIDFDGKLVSCGLSGTIDLGTSTDNHEFIDCFSEVAGTSTPIIDCDNLTNNNIQFRRYSGGIEIRNFVNGASVMSIDMAQGNVIIDSTCVGGIIVVRGISTLTDNSGAGCTVITSGLLQPNLIGSGTSFAYVS